MERIISQLPETGEVEPRGFDSAVIARFSRPISIDVRFDGAWSRRAGELERVLAEPPVPAPFAPGDGR